jgi:hypothetical protein
VEPPKDGHEDTCEPESAEEGVKVVEWTTSKGRYRT